MKCSAITSTGNPCKAHALRDDKYCFRHSKEFKREALAASANGGRARRQLYCFGKRMKINSPDDIKKLMAKAINSLWTGEMPASNPAGSLGYLAKIFLEAYDKSELELRIEALEKKLDAA